MAETGNNISRLDELINQLPDNFPGAAEMIKCEIAPLINDCDSWYTVELMEDALP